MKKVIYGLLLSCFGAVFSAWASDATLKAEATFIHAGCNLTGESKTMTVPLGNVHRNDVIHSSYVYPTLYFKLKATGCPTDGSARVGIRFDGSGLNSIYGQYFYLDKESTAKGVHIVIGTYDESGYFNRIGPGEERAGFVPDSLGEATLGFYTGYYTSGSNRDIVPGSANATVQISLVYR
ncbi:type 1 fimbrial protein [Serratia marcescens]|nr:type 1 fimbrial protein [Serratia marcescens]